MVNAFGDNLIETVERALRCASEVECYKGPNEHSLDSDACFTKLCEEVKDRLGLEQVPPVQSRLHMYAVSILKFEKTTYHYLSYS